jgi:hypothetical protein
MTSRALIPSAVLIATGLALGLCASPAFAQSDAENRATARALGQQGQDAYDAKDFKKAEDLFRRAEGLYHAPTLLLGLARTQAAGGKFVEAWEGYNRIILEGVTSTPAFAKALEDAKKEIGTIDARRSQVVITVSGPDAPHVTLDEAPIKSEALGVALFLNPGTHVVKVTADGFNPGLRSFTVGEGKTENVALTLEHGSGPATGPATAGPSSGTATGQTSGTADMSSGSPNHVPAFIGFGVGGAGLILGAVTGGLAIGKHSTLKGECPGGVCTTPTSQSDLSSYHTMGTLSTVGFIVGGVGVATGVMLWVFAPKSAAPATGWITPYVGPGNVGAVGRF